MKRLALAYFRMPWVFVSMIKFITGSVAEFRLLQLFRNCRLVIIPAAFLIGAFAAPSQAAVFNGASVAETLQLLGVRDAAPDIAFIQHAGPVSNGAFFVNGNGTGLVITSADCFLIFSTQSQNFSSSAGSGGFGFTTSDPSCQASWTASTNDSWIHIVNTSGTANGTFPSIISFTITANTTGAPRSGTITVTSGSNVYTLTINQGIPCSFMLSGSSANIAASGGSGEFSVTAAVGCTWTAQSNDSWIHITSGGSGNGGGTVAYSVDANAGPARTGTITAAGQTFTVNQANGCTFTLVPTNANLPTGGGTGSFDVTTGAGCAWTASSNDSWINVTSGANGNGTGSVSYAVEANTGPARTGSITAGGQTFTITQASGCTFVLSPTNTNIQAAGGNGSFNVTTSPGCTWTAVSNDSWITITSGSNGTGSGTVSYSVQANTGIARTGTITAGGQTFTIDQANGCTFTLSPTSTGFGVNGGNGSFSVTAGVGCTWSASSNDSFINITSGQGSGNGTVTFTVQANPGSSSRSGTITVGDKTFTVNQSGSSSCTFGLTPPSANISAAGGTSSFNVTADQGCTWSAVSNDSWIHVMSGGSGSGSGTVGYSVDANTGPARSGSISVGGQTFTVTQSSGCTFVLTPTNTNAPANGLNGSFNVTTGAGCSWTAISNDSWINITSGGGSGSGTVTFTVQANSGAPRTGTVTVGGQTFTVNQVGGCTVSLSAASTNVPVNGGSGSFNVLAGEGCTWSAVSNASWIHITSGSNGNGNGTVAFTVDPNSGATRSGTISVGGQTFTVNQGSSCNYSAMVSSNVPFPPVGGDGTVNVSTSIGCEWTATTNDSWIIIHSGSGTGIGSFTFTVLPNSGPSRTGEITVGGQTVLISQVEGCVFTVSPTQGNIPARGGSIQFTVNTSPGCNWDTFTNSPWLSTVSSVDSQGRPTVIVTAEANPGQSRTGTIEVHGATFTVFQAGFIPARADFDGDGRTDPSFYRPSEGNWYLLRSQKGVAVANWGTSGDIPTPADYDHDSKADLAVYRPETGQWFILRSSDSTFAIVNWGNSTDRPVAADYDGDGRADIAIYRPETGEWIILRSSDGSSLVTQWGTSTDLPVPGYYDADNAADIAVYRPSSGTWFILQSSGVGISVQWGANGDRPVPADYDGDNRDDIAIYRPSTGNWFVLRSTDLTVSVVAWGQPNDIPVPGDYDGDERDDIAQYRPSNGHWYILGSRSGFAEIPWGTLTDKPIPAAYIP